MQLLLKRNQSAGAMSRPTFKLWAQFELTEEEQALIDRYRVHRAVLSEGDPERDLTTSAKRAAVLAVMVTIVAVTQVSPYEALTWGLAAFAAGTYLIYQQIREEIRVSDLLTGRSFSCRSVMTLIEKERTVTDMAVVFRQFLEAMKTWGGAEVVQIEPREKPTVRVVEPRHAAA